MSGATGGRRNRHSNPLPQRAEVQADGKAGDLGTAEEENAARANTLSSWAPLLAELVAARDISDYWKRLAALLLAVSPYSSAIAWNDWSTVVFGGTVKRDAGGEGEPSLEGAWRDYMLATAALQLSDDPSKSGPIVLGPAQLRRADNFYRQYFQPAGLEHVIVIPFRRESIVRAGMTLFRTGQEGGFADADVALLREIHSLLEALMERVLEHDRHHATQASVLEVLGDLPVGLVLLDWELNPVFGNPEGYRQTQRWIRLSDSAASVAEAAAGLQLPADLRAACDDLRRNWEANDCGRRCERHDLLRQLQHPNRSGFKATVAIPLPYRGVCGAPSFLIRYTDAAPSNSSALEPSAAQLAVLRQLTVAQRSVALLVVQGKSNREIAELLHREITTVKDHLGHIYGKLGIRNRIQLAALLGSSVELTFNPLAKPGWRPGRGTP